ncbi:MAG: hypothetical protein GXC94_06720 [Comamonadaceae bacterium]|nr:hypothetical protein [Comamonadaceae bacterium]
MSFLKVTLTFAIHGFVFLFALSIVGVLGDWTVPAAAAAAFVSSVWGHARSGPQPRNRRPASGGAAAASRGGSDSSGLGTTGALAGLGLAAAAGAAAHEFMGSDDLSPSWSGPVFNPATGLPMIGDSHAGLDVGGNSYGSSDAFGSGLSGSDSFGTDSFGSDSFGSGSFGSDSW